MRKSYIILLLVILNVLELAGQSESRNIRRTATATGRTTGHVADIRLTNTTNNLQHLDIGPFSTSTGGRYQSYFIPESISTDIPPGSTVNIPLKGYCTDAFLTPPPAGTILSIPEGSGANPNSPQQDVLQKIIRAAESLQQDGQFFTPLSGNPEKERESIIQHTIWVYTSGGSVPYDFNTFCERIRQTWQKTPDQGSNPNPTLTEGINQLWNAIVQTGTEADVPNFRIPSLPPSAHTLIPAPASSLPQVTNSIVAKGTGRTTGHIADLTLYNPTDRPVIVQFGPGSEPFDGSIKPPVPTPLFIPASGQYQPYIVPTIPPIELLPGQRLTVPVQGFCTDIHRPPVPAGDGMPPVSQWVSVPTQIGGPPAAPEPMNPPGTTTVIAPTQTAMPLEEAVRILLNTRPRPLAGLPFPDQLPQGANSGAAECIPVLISPAPNIPGTDFPIPVPIDPNEYPSLAVPILADALNRIMKTYDELKPQGGIQTPFRNNPEKEREAVIQQTFWLYSSALSGESYRKGDFRDNTIRQLEQSSNKPIEEIPKPQLDKIEQGVDDFWNTFEAVGAEAKVLKVPPAIPNLPDVQDFWNDYDSGSGKRLPGSEPGKTDPPQGIQPGEETESPPELIQNRERDKCDCGIISFENNIKHTREGKPVDEKKPEMKLSFSNEVIPNKNQRKFIDGPAALTGDKIDLEIKDLKTLCAACGNKCSAEEVKITIQIGELNTNNGRGSNNVQPVETQAAGASGYSASAIMPDGNMDVGIFITVSYVCTDKRPRNPCDQAKCEDTFVLKLKRLQSCECGEIQFDISVSHTPKGEKKQTRDLTFGGENQVMELDWSEAVAKDDLIGLKMKTLTAKCTGCNNSCKPEGDLQLFFSGSQISGLKSREDAAKKPIKYRKDDLLFSNKKITGDNGDIHCTITIMFNCASSGADCVSKACEKDYTIVFKRK